MEELRIKCPSCGIILDVRNSKNEAVKRIVCPHCKKHLAVTFHDETPQSPYVSVKKVQLADGTTKTIVKALTADHIVKINGEPLQQGDEVVLLEGDKLQVEENSTHPIPPLPKVPSNPPSSQGHFSFYYIIFGVACVLGAILWKYSTHTQPNTAEMAENKDTVTLVTKEPPITKKQPENSQREQKPEVKKERLATSKTDKASLSSYELERLAMDGDVDAQYQLGKRWISRHDSVNVVKGIKYLKLAARNGSSEANRALSNVFAALRQSAANGSSTAANILREQQ